MKEHFENRSTSDEAINEILKLSGLRFEPPCMSYKQQLHYTALPGLESRRLHLFIYP